MGKTGIFTTAKKRAFPFFFVVCNPKKHLLLPNCYEKLMNAKAHDIDDKLFRYQS